MSCIVLLVVLCRAVQGQSPSNDDGLLNFVRDAQRTNYGLFESGELDASTESMVARTQADRIIGEVRSTTTCTMRWKGAKTFWVYEKTEVRREKDQKETRTFTGRMLHDGERLHVYLPEAKLVQTMDAKAAEVSPDLELRPDQLWFRRPVVWLDFLGGNSEQPANHIVRYDLSRRGDDEVVIKGHLTSGAVAELTVSLRFSGNVTNYAFAPKKGLGRKGSYKWTTDSDGRSILVEHHNIEFKDRREAAPIRTYLAKVTRFTTATAFQESQFTFDALGIAPNTRVEDMITGKRSTFRPAGAAGTDPSEGKLKELSDVLSSRGFGVGTR